MHRPSRLRAGVPATGVAALAVGLLVVAAGGCRTLPPAPPCSCAAALAAGGASCPPLAAAPAGTAAPAPTNLVFEGGGVKGVAYGGALQVLAAVGGLERVERVGGTSAGSITALLVALGYSAEEITAIILDLDFRRFRDGTFLRDSERLFEEYGWYPGNTATCLFECLVERRLGDRLATFADLHRRAATDPAFRDLYVVATDLDRSHWVVFSHESPQHADVPLAHAVRASMSIPFYFTAQRIAGQTLVDGGVMRNYPIDLFDRADPSSATLGFFLGGLGPEVEVKDFEQFTKQVIESLVAVQNADFCVEPDNIRRSVFIDPLGIATTDFDLTLEQKCALIRSGAAGLRAHLEAPATECPQRLHRDDPRSGG
ncbi:MAG TPA: patatin-like phospholipase family protein [Thermoanaerobaculia bacterium]|nr:patatin-like phospholipase family protein [Thermoanaerobaculia bacterium]